MTFSPSGIEFSGRADGRRPDLAGIQHHDGGSFGLLDQSLHKGRLPEQTSPERELSPASPDHNVTDPIFLGKLQDRFDHVLALVGEDGRPELLRQGQRIGEHPLGLGIDLGRAFRGGLHIHGVPVAVQTAGQARGIAQQRLAVRAARAEADHHLVGAGGSSSACGARRRESICAASSRRVSSRNCSRLEACEEVGERRLDAFGRVDLAFLQPAAQVFGRDVHVDDLVGLGHHAIRYAFAHLDAGDPLDGVVQALQVLDVQGGNDVDSGCQDLLHILEPLGIAAAGDIRVRQLIHQHHCGFAGEDRVQIHLLDLDATINQSPARDHLQPLTAGIRSPRDHGSRLARPRHRCRRL